MPPTPPPAHALAAGLAARLLHDMAGPVAGLVSGLELWAAPGPADLKAEAADLAGASAATLVDTLEFSRAAFGGVGEARHTDALAKLAHAPFAGKRARLVWAVDPMTVGGEAGSALLIMAQIGAGALPRGGEVRVSAVVGPEALVLRLEGEGPRVMLGPEILEGLEGRPHTAGPAGRWAPAAYLNAIITAADGVLTQAPLADGFRIEATLPRRGAAEAAG